MKLSIYDLAYEYFTMFWPPDKPVPKDVKARVLMDFWGLLAAGWTVEEMLDHLKQARAKAPGVEPCQGNLLVFFSKLKPVRRNLLIPGNIYFHSELRITPPAPVIDVDINTGEIKYETEEYYMEYRASYSLEDLITFYSWAVEPVKRYQLNRYKSVFNHMLQTHSVDNLLFMIDIVANKVRRGEIKPPGGSPIVILDYEKPAQEVMYEYITELTQNGGLNVVYKRRIPLDRRGSGATQVSS